ncbi:MAG TPA: amino acid adenylation domain-containing protein, partial [Longimicrobium sp.]
MDRIVARHEALRTTFAPAEGEPVQRITPAGESKFLLIRHDLSAHPDADGELRRIMIEEGSALFDLHDGPLIRGRLIRLGEHDHVLVVTMHHIVSDGWSMGVLTHELSTLYGAFHRGEPDPLPALPIQYADYAVWQRKWVEGDVLRDQAEYWRATLAGAPELLELPADRPRPALQSLAGDGIALELDAELTAGLKMLGQRHGTTLFMTVLAGWAAVLGRLSGQDEVVIGTPTANRGQAEIEGLIGFFVNTLALRVDLSGAPPVTDLLTRVREVALAAQNNQDIPFEQVVELARPARSMAHTPLFQVLFTWQNAPTGAMELPGLSVGSARGDSLGVAKFDLSLSLGESGDRITGGVSYATALYERDTVERYVGYLRRALEEMVASDRQQVGRLELLPPMERAQVVEGWNATDADFPRETCIHELFEVQVERTPDAVALVFEGESLTYAQLNARANQLAHHLRELGVGPDARVAVSLERSLEMMVALMGVLKAGGAYVPLDPSYPADRVRYMLADSAPMVLLTQAALAAEFADAGMPVVALDGADGPWTDQPTTNPARDGLTPQHLAYVIYTSGSTGRPKGVMCHHIGAVNRLVWMQDAFGLEAGEAVLQKTSFSFDVSVWEFFWPMMVGARLVMARPEGHKDPEYLVETIRAAGITTMHFVPSMLQLFLEHSRVESCDGLKRVVCSGEALPASLARQFHEKLAHAELHNLYGPTEAAVDVTWWRSTPEETRGRIPIGAPISNTRLYVLDRSGQPVLTGVAGELHIGGVQVARGYLNRPELTADRFIPDAFSTEPGARLYRTGDLARWLADGTIDYLGRNDHQVKVRGFRIELGEIEARLAEHAAVRETVVLAREETGGGTRLVAYLVAAGDAAETDALRAYLADHLPDYMVPAAFVWLDALPLSPNGKVDRTALPAPEGDAFAARGYEAPLGDVERSLAEVWAEVLGVERVGRWDHFFELGGHSLLAVRVISRIRQALGVEVTLGDLFARPVLAEFARALPAAESTTLPAIEPADRSEPLPLSFAQQRLWFLEQMGAAGRAYHIPAALRLRGGLDTDALSRALDRIVERHEALRTTFAQVDGEPIQRIEPARESCFDLVRHDLWAHADADAELRRIMSEEGSALFDLHDGPLVRGRLIRLCEDDHVLLVTMHHIVSDGWSMGVLTHELSTLYGAFHRGEADPLPTLPIQYADYAVWQRKWIEGDVLREQAEYWRSTLAGAPELLELPTDRPRPAIQSLAGDSIALELDAELTAGLKMLGQRHGTTLFMTVLAGWAAVLARLSGQDDVVIGTPTANRGQAEIERLIGFFVNTLALRMDLSGAPSVAELLERVRARALAAQQHQDIPFEQVVELAQPTRSMAHTPLFSVMFTWQNAPRGTLELPGLAAGSVGSAAHVTAKFDLSLTMQESGGRISGVVEYATALFDAATVERFLGYFRAILAGMVADEWRAVQRLPMLSASERSLVLDEWNATDAQYPRESFVHELFEAQAARTPDAPAVVHDDRALTYAELNGRANQLAHGLRELGVSPGARVAICIEHSPEMVVALLGVLKAGAAYVPLDPSHPADRLRDMLDDSAPRAVLTQRSLAVLFAGTDVPVLELEEDAAWSQQPRANLGGVGARPEDAAYVIYTSGSTGRPKGVSVPHAALTHYATWARSRYSPEGPLAFALYSSLAFDLTVTSIYVPLISGGSVVVYGRAENGDTPILRVFADDRVDVVKLTPAHLMLLALGAQPETRVAILADRSADALVGLLGILAAGAAYVPLDPSHPADRLRD